MQTEQDQDLERGERTKQVVASNIDVVNEQSASPEVQGLYRQFREEFGRSEVPGILQCFATHPPLLSHMMGLAKSMVFADGALGRRYKEMISTFVSASNECRYCADSHGYAFRMQGGSAVVLDAVLACDVESRSVTEAERTLLQFVKKISESSQSVAPTDVAAMRSAGWSDLQIAETIHVTALFATFNRVVNAFGVPTQGLLKQFEEKQPDAKHGDVA